MKVGTWKQNSPRSAAHRVSPLTISRPLGAATVVEYRVIGVVASRNSATGHRVRANVSRHQIPARTSPVHSSAAATRSA
jgi:hypothetical protein